MLVSLIAVTCQSVLVVIVGTFVEVPLEVYAVCVANAACFQAIVVSIALSLSYTAFFVGA